MPEDTVQVNVTKKQLSALRAELHMILLGSVVDAVNLCRGTENADSRSAESIYQIAQAIENHKFIDGGLEDAQEQVEEMEKEEAKLAVLVTLTFSPTMYRALRDIAGMDYNDFWYDLVKFSNLKPETVKGLVEKEKEGLRMSFSAVNQKPNTAGGWTSATPGLKQ